MERTSNPNELNNTSPETNSPKPETPTAMSRRRFLGNVGKTTAAGLAAGAVGIKPLVSSEGTVAQANEVGPQSPAQRQALATGLRIERALTDAAAGIPPHPCNEDEQNLPNFIGNYSKGLRHNAFTGEVISSAYHDFVEALDDGTFQSIEALVNKGAFGCRLPGGGHDQARQRRLVNPLAGLALDLESKDSQQYAIRPAPKFRSAEEAGEMAELYWMALLRDVSFSDYVTSPLAIAAANDLSGFSDFRGPKQGGVVTTQTLFRDNFPGCTIGPYISQFLVQDAGYGAQTIDMRIRGSVPGIDFGTNFNSWLEIQNGCVQPPTPLENDPHFCSSGRDIGQYVHVDALYQAYQVATLISLGGGFRWDQNNPYGQTPEGGAGSPLPIGTPGARAQVAFGTLGGPDILTLVCEAATRALHAVWFQKWFVHRRLRPEEFGGRVEVIRLGRRSNADYQIHQDLFDSSVLSAVQSKFGSRLLPLAFTEGSPLHPSYGAGHATVAGACTTVLKAFLDESQVIPNPVFVDGDGNRQPFIGPPLTVGGELNKVASNIATGRNIAGVHWRSDGVDSILLGEEIALSLLRNWEKTYREPFNGFRLTRFNGQTITI